MGAAAVSADAIQVRLDEQNRRLIELERTQPAVIANEVRQLRTDVHELREEIRDNKRAQWALATALLIGALSVALTGFQIAGPG